MKLPKQIRVGYRNIKIEAMTGLQADAEECHGRFNDEQGIVKVRQEDRPDAFQANTLMHELFHAIWKEQGLDDTAKEETVCDRFATGVLQLFRDNPNLYPTLMEAIK